MLADGGDGPAAARVPSGLAMDVLLRRCRLMAQHIGADAQVSKFEIVHAAT
jgi:hypothetical protein